MRCKLCGSDTLEEFNAEVAVHFPGREGLSKPLAFVFPKLLVCFDCGFTEFVVPRKELDVLATGSSNRESRPSTTPNPDLPCSECDVVGPESNPRTNTTEHLSGAKAALRADCLDR